MRRAPASLVLFAALAGTPAFAGDCRDDEAWAARTVVEDYYEAIGSEDFRTAYALWGEEGAASGQSFEAFAAGFDETASVAVFTGPTQPEGAAGSLYATVPVRVEAELDDGTEQRFAGTYELRRVNDVPGSSEEDRHWHIAAADLTAR